MGKENITHVPAEQKLFMTVNICRTNALAYNQLL
jgi:hypothetical protein